MAKKTILWVIGVILVLGLISLAVYIGSIKQSSQEVIASETPDIEGSSLNKERIDNCSTEEECIDVLQEMGMPTNYLENNDFEISCNGGICYVKK